MGMGISMRAIWKVTSSELLTKQAMRKKNVIYKKEVLKLFLSVVTAGVEALVLLGNSLCIPVSKKSAVCELGHILTPSINSLLLRCVIPTSSYAR
jgi:hypothetical protein